MLELNRWQIDASLLFTVTSLVLFLYGSVSYFMQIQEFERQRSEKLLLNVLPKPIAKRLKNGEAVIADTHEEATILFSDLVGFTQLSQELTVKELVQLLDEIFRRFDQLANRHQLEKIKTIGDAYMAAAGIPESSETHAEDAANMALDMMSVIEEISQEFKISISMRIGLHTGEVIAGVIGSSKFAYDLWGDTVNTASRMESHSIQGKVQVSEATAEKLRESHQLEERDEIEVKGKGKMKTYFLLSKIDS